MTSLLAAALVLSSPASGPIVGARFLALSPDGSRLAFSYQGDVWVAPADGGRARQVTTHVDMDSYPVWSPDGKTLAFASTRFGSWDIFTVSADGGSPKRITFDSRSDIPSSWTPDGQEILFDGRRDDTYDGILAINVETKRFRQFFRDTVNVGSPKISPDGRKILYTRIGFPEYRGRYNGSGASQLWIYDIAAGQRIKLRSNNLQHLWPNWSAAGIDAVTMGQPVNNSRKLNQPLPPLRTDANTTPNAYRIAQDGKAQRWTDSPSVQVRFLSVAADGKSSVYELDGEVYRQALPGGEAKKIEIHAEADDKTNQEERLILTRAVGGDGFSLSPDGKEFAFSVRGEVWTVPTQKGEGPNRDDARQVTTWEGQDIDPVYSPDGKALFYVSDVSGDLNLYRYDFEKREATAITSGVGSVYGLTLTPDGSKLSFWRKGSEGGIYTVPVGGGTPTRILKRGSSFNLSPFAWSPDGRWIAYSDILQESGYYYWESASNIHILNVETGETRNVTQLAARHSDPAWSADGKHLYFTSDRQGAGLYVLPLQPVDQLPSESRITFTKPEGPVKVDINFDRIEERVRRLSGLSIGGTIQVDQTDGTLYFPFDGDIWRANPNGEDGRRITGERNVAGFDWIQSLRTFAYSTTDGRFITLDVKGPQPRSAEVTFRADWTRDVRKERNAAYTEFWRTYGSGFYDAGFHGRDWKALGDRYRKHLSSVGHPYEMSVVLNMLVCEVEASHSEVNAPASLTSGPSTASLGFTIDTSHRGTGLKIAEVPARSPGSFEKTRLYPGEIVTQINGRDVRADEDLAARILNNEAGRDLNLTVQSLSGRTRQVKYRALSGGEFSGLVNENTLQDRRRMVKEMSNDKLAYLHISGMNGPAMDRFFQQLWQFAANKKGIIIDVRGNGGGNTSDRIIDVLERKINSYYSLRDDQTIKGPGQALGLPMVVMCAENSFSNAEMFPYAMRVRGLAEIVGQPTSGYVIYTGGFRLVDGTSCRLPGTGVYRLNGTSLENLGEVPDHIVEFTPEEFFRGQDPQLAKAVEVLLKK